MKSVDGCERARFSLHRRNKFLQKAISKMNLSGKRIAIGRNSGKHQKMHRRGNPKRRISQVINRAENALFSAFLFWKNDDNSYK